MSKATTERQSGIGAPTDENENENDDYQARVAARAESEAMTFALGAPGHVKVTNLSHGDESARDHRYLVTVEDGATVRCTCPADEYRPGPCKHRLAVANEPAVMLAASASPDAVREARGMDQ